MSIKILIAVILDSALEEKGLVTIECFSLGRAVNSELANAISCELVHEIGLHQKYVIIDLFNCWLGTTKKALTSHQILFLMRR